MDTETIDLLIVISAVMTVVYIILRISIRKRKPGEGKVSTLHDSMSEFRDKGKQQTAQEVPERKDDKNIDKETFD